MTAVARPDGWPDLPRAALYGIAGEIVGRLLPHTEADPAGLLITFLAMFANATNSGPHAVVSGQPHRLRINAVLVGRTSGGRKGTAAGTIRPIFERADPEWSSNRCQSGLASGEGLISAVRDASGDDPGVTDKRLFITEQEFGRPLRIGGREHSILTFVIREAWDSDRLCNLTRKEPQIATRAHVGIVGHITDEELATTLAGVDVWNGFANRHLWALVNRWQLLPSGGGLEEADYEELGRAVTTALTRARQIGRMRRTTEAETVWDALYRVLDLRDVSGRLAAITDRAEAQLLRLSMLYAVLDGSSMIDVAHLEAAWALLWYCEESAAVIFGERTADRHSERILAALRQNPEGAGLDRTQIHRLFSSNLKAADLNRILGDLADAGMVEKVTAPPEGRGRPRTVYYLTNYEVNESDEVNETGAPPGSFIPASSFVSLTTYSVPCANGTHDRARVAAAEASS